MDVQTASMLRLHDGRSIGLLISNGREMQYQARTSLALCRSPPGYGFTRLARTRESTEIFLEDDGVLRWTET